MVDILGMALVTDDIPQATYHYKHLHELPPNKRPLAYLVYLLLSLQKNDRQYASFSAFAQQHPAPDLIELDHGIARNAFTVLAKHVYHLMQTPSRALLDTAFWQTQEAWGWVVEAAECDLNGYPLIFAFLATVYIRHGAYQRYLDIMQEIMAEYPLQSPHPLHRLLTEHAIDAVFHLGRYREMLVISTEFLQTYRYVPTILAEYALAQLRLGRKEVAMRFLDHHLAMQPTEYLLWIAYFLVVASADKQALAG